MPTISLTLIRPGADGPELFWARRCDDRAFLGGFHAFFAGSVEPVDRTVADRLQADDAHLRLAAIRETFEECGLLLTDDGIDRFPPGGRPAQAVTDTADRLALGRLEPLGWWTMPKWMDLSYTTAFFGVRLTRREGELLDDLADDLDDREFDSGGWIDADRALEKWHTGEVFLTRPIRQVIESVADADAAPQAFPSPSAFGDTVEQAGSSGVGEICGGVVMIPLKTPTLPPATHTNCLVVGKQRYVVIDPGPAGADALEPLTSHLDARDGEFAAIVLTHHHRDHIGGVHPLVEQFDVPVFAHPDTLDRLPDADGLELRPVADGDRIDVDHPGELVAMHTPGHAPGHLAFHQPHIDMVFGGDLVASRGTIIIDPPQGHMGDYLASLRQIRNLAPRALMPSHGQMTTRPVELIREYIDHRNMREQKIADALAEHGPATAAELVPHAYPDAPEAVYPLAERSLLAHLIHLQEQNRATVNDGQWRSVAQ